MLDLSIDNVPLIHMTMSSVKIIRGEVISITKIKPLSHEKYVVPYGIIFANNGIRLNNWVRSITQLTSYQFYQIIGHLLGDGTLEPSRTARHPRFCFTQTFKRFDYLWSVYNNLNNLCQKLPTPNKGIRNGTNFYNLVIHTRSYPFWSDFYNLFYPEINGLRIKIVPDELFLYLNPIVLAYWAMDDGAKAGESGFYLHTKGFSFKDVYKLAGMLHYHFSFIVTVQSHEKRPVIYITSKDLPKFKQIILPYFHKSMLYKLTPKNERSSTR